MPAERHPLWAQLPAVREPTAEQLARVQQAVEERVRARRLRRRRWGPGLLLGLGLVWWLLSVRTPVAVVDRPKAAPPAASALLDRRTEAETPPPPVAAPRSQAPVVSVAAPMGPARHAKRPMPGRAGTPAASLSEPSQAPIHAVPDDAEAELLSQAILRLRRAQDPRGALEALATYREAFPHGALRGEATLVQAESLARLGRQQELVAMLAPEALGDLPRSTELKLLRGEALSKLERCSDAIPVFDEILSPGEGGATIESRLRERALYGRALCRLHKGQIAAARRDLELEEAEFPEQAEKVHQTLRSIAGQP